MDLANLMGFAGAAAGLVAVGILAWWLRGKMCALITIGKVGFCGGDLRNLGAFFERVRNDKEERRDPAKFLLENETEILLAMGRLVESFDCRELLSKLVIRNPIGAFWLGVAKDCPGLVQEAAQGPAVDREDIGSALSDFPPYRVKQILVRRWREITGEEWVEPSGGRPQLPAERAGPHPETSQGTDWPQAQGR